MPSDPIGVYLDANVLLAYVSSEDGRVDVVDQILRESAKGARRLQTSTLSIVEVAFSASEAEQKELDPAVETAIDSLWEPNSPIELVEPSIAIMRGARRLLRQSKVDGRSLKPADAIHLATAMMPPNITHLFSYETASTLAFWAELTALEVAEPFVNEPPLPFGRE